MATPRLWLGALAVLAGVGCTCDRSPAEPDGGRGAVDGSVTVDGGRGAPDANDADVDVGRPIALTEESQLRLQIAGLEALLDGRVPARVDPETLFDVDVLDESARQARLAELRAAIHATEARARRPPAAPSPDARAPTLDGAVEAGAAPPRHGGAASPEPRDVATASRDAGPRDAEVAQTPDGVLALRLERDRLRLAFLSLSASERAAVEQALRERRRLAAEEEASRADAVRASAAIARANVARRDALDRAATTVSAISRDLLAESAQVEDARAALARWQGRVARERQEMGHQDADALALAHELERQLDAASLTPTEADRRYEVLVARLGVHRRELGAALDELGRDSSAPEYEPQLDPAARLYRDRPERADLVEALAAFETARARAVSEERALRWDRAERLASNLQRLDRLRVELLPHMTRTRRETVHGLGAEGATQAGRELAQIRLLALFWARGAMHELPSAPARVATMLTRSSTRNELLGALALVVALVVTWRRRDGITAWLREQVHERTGGRRWVEVVRPFWAVIGALIVPLVVLVGLHLLFAVLADLFESRALSAARIVTLSLAWFFFAVTATGRLFTSRLRYGATRAAMVRRVFASTRLVLGFALAAWLMLRLSELLVGRGYLYTVVVDLAWVGAVPLGGYLVHAWAEDVTTAHRERYPSGLCARSLAAKDTRWRRYILAMPAAAQLAVFGATTAVSDLALRFEQARRAVTFLVRRRLERQLERTSEVSDPEPLPAAVCEAFEGAAIDPAIEIDHYPQLDHFAAALARWQDGGPGLSAAIVGERGSGKTTWMHALARTASLDAEPVDVPNGLRSAADVLGWVAALLDLDGIETVDELTREVEERGLRRVLLLDHCQNLVVRAIGGTAALGALVEIAARTSASLVWVCAFSRYTWLYVGRARQTQDLFRERVELGPWPEAKIAALVRRRMEALGVEASFEDLVVDRLRGNALEDAVLRTEGEYLRLLWDYSDGNPRVAMHFWLRSLASSGEQLRVRLFAAPRPEALEDLHEQSRFLLAAVVLHENVTAADVAATVGLSLAESAALFSFLEQHELVEPYVDGSWRVTLHWYREVIRYLRRKRLLFD